MVKRKITDRDIWSIWKEWDAEREAKSIERWVKEYFDSHYCYNAVLGLSGGLDSSTVAYLTVNALGGDKVIGVIMPDDEATPAEDIADALRVVNQLGVESHHIYITPIVKKYVDSDPRVAEKTMYGAYRFPNAYGNIKSRIRMTLLYSAAQTSGVSSLVVGTTDKSELLMGYFTKYGDGGADIEPIKHLYKTQIRLLGRHLGVPESIVRKPSSPRLLPNQTAEEELGINYEKLDFVLYHLVDLGYTKSQILGEFEIDGHVVDKVRERVAYTKHKREMPPGPI